MNQRLFLAALAAFVWSQLPTPARAQDMSASAAAAQANAEPPPPVDNRTNVTSIEAPLAIRYHDFLDTRV